MTDSPPEPSTSPGELLESGAAAGAWTLDPAPSQVTFAVKHFWGAIVVRGTFALLTGEGSVGTDGTMTGRLSIDASSVTTKNKKRDEHLRSKDFFDAEHHREVVVAVTSAELAGPEHLACRGTLEAAGHVEPVEFTADVEGGTPGAVTLRAELVVDRTKFAMTWSPLGMASKVANATVVARFVRS